MASLIAYDDTKEVFKIKPGEVVLGRGPFLKVKSLLILSFLSVYTKMT